MLSDEKPWRVYLEKGHVTHLLLPHQSPNSDFEPAMCGTGAASWNGWRGTGTQDEWERAAELPLCLNCQRRLRRPGLL